MIQVRPTLKTLHKEMRRAWLAYRITRARIVLHELKSFRIRDAVFYLNSSLDGADRNPRALGRFLKQCGYRFDQKTKTWGLP